MGPLMKKSTRPAAIEFSMIVLMTSWTLRFALRMPATQAHSAPKKMPPRDRQRDQEDARQVQRVADPGRHQAAQDQLTLRADVEQADLEGDRHREAGQDQRRRLLQGAQQAVAGSIQADEKSDL